MVFGHKTIITSFLQIMCLHKLHFCASYEQVYYNKTFQTFSIKTLVTVALAKCREYYEIGLKALEVKLASTLHSLDLAWHLHL